MQEYKRLLKYFFLLLIIFLLLFNWSRALLVSNYQVLWYEFTSLFTHRTAREEVPLTPKTSVEERKKQAVPQKETTPSLRPNLLEIPKINVLAPIITVSNEREKTLTAALKKGVLLFPGYEKPGANGLTVILGHSAPMGWPNINYDNVFDNLNRLQRGDRIIVQYAQKKYVYLVEERGVFWPNEEGKFISPEDITAPTLFLVTCWPRGKDYKRLFISAVLQK